MVTFRKTAASAALAVPSLADLSPEYARLKSRDRELRTRLAEVELALDALSFRRTFVSSDTRVAALVDGVDVAEPADNSADQRADLQQERSDLRAAVDIVRNKLAAERVTAS